MFTALKALEYLNNDNTEKLKKYLTDWAMEEAAKEAGGSSMKKRAAAVKRCFSELVKTRPNVSGAFVAEDGIQVICNGYYAVLFDQTEAIHGCIQAETPIVNDYKKFMVPYGEQDEGEHITMRDIKTIRAQWTADGKPKATGATYAYPVVKLNKCFFNTDFLLDCMDLIGVKELYIRQQTYQPEFKPAAICANGKEYGIVLPLRYTEGDTYYEAGAAQTDQAAI